MEKIKLNVGGIEFSLPKDILIKIPYFNNVNLTEEIFIPRSALGFNHVISFVLDDEYCFPVEYKKELDFYKVNYDASKLYDPYKRFIEFNNGGLLKVNKDLNVINNNILVINDKINEYDKTNKRKLNKIEDNTDCIIQ